jgi:hypothetical protein
VPAARRRSFFTLTLEWKKTPSAREVADPRTPESLHPASPTTMPRSNIGRLTYSIRIRRIEIR